MKAFWLSLLASALALDAWGQGDLGFANHIKGLIDAPVFDTDCHTPLAGTRYLSEFYAGPTPDTLQPSGTIVPFSTGPGAGYVLSDSDMIWDGYDDGTIFYVQMRAWEASAGASFEAAVASGGKFGFSNIVPEALRLAPGGEEEPVGLRSFCLISPSGQQPQVAIAMTPPPQPVLIGVIGIKGWTVSLEVSSNCTSWTSISTNVLTNSLWFYSDSAPPADKRFYKAFLQQN